MASEDLSVPPNNAFHSEDLQFARPRGECARWTAWEAGISECPDIANSSYEGWHIRQQAMLSALAPLGRDQLALLVSAILCRVGESVSPKSDCSRLRSEIL
jgi:hypothetical protein